MWGVGCPTVERSPHGEESARLAFPLPSHKKPALETEIVAAAVRVGIKCKYLCVSVHWVRELRARGRARAHAPDSELEGREGTERGGQGDGQV